MKISIEYFIPVGDLPVTINGHTLNHDAFITPKGKVLCNMGYSPYDVDFENKKIPYVKFWDEENEKYCERWGYPYKFDEEDIKIIEKWENVNSRYERDKYLLYSTFKKEKIF